MNNAFAKTFQESLKPKSIQPIFEKEPVDLDTFLYDKSYLGLSIRLSEPQTEVLYHSTQIYRKTELESLGWKIYRQVSEIYLQWGKGSGKDLISILTQARIADLLLNLKDPQAYWGTENIMPIDMINMAYNAEQAKFNFYEPMRRLIMRSPRFKNMADDKEKHIVFAKNIFAHSGHSDEDSAEGKSLILAVLDEISAFKSRQEFSNLNNRFRPPKYSYEALVDAMKSSQQSRFDTGKLIAISYPRYKGCPIQQLYNSGLADNKKYGEKSRVYVSFGKTWEINPVKKLEQFESERRRNPGLVKSKYECDPSQAEDAFIKNFEIIEATFPDVEEDAIIHTLCDYPVLKSGIRCNHDYACSVHIDLGLSKCRAGFAMTHQSGVKYERAIDMDTGEEKLIELPEVTIDVITSFQAPISGEIDFSEIRRFLFSLRNAGYHISIVSYDQWNSAGERQTLEKAGFNIVKRSVDLDKSMYDDLVIMMTEKRLLGGYAAYRNIVGVGVSAKICIVKEELQGLVELRGKKIDHRPNGTKDESDSLAGSVRGSIEFGLWRFGTSLPGGQNLDSVSAPYAVNEKAEIAIISQMKANNGELRLPGNMGYRGIPNFTGR